MNKANSKARSANLYRAACILVDGAPEADPGLLARKLAMLQDCHQTTAWRHIRRALAAKTGQSGVSTGWGGKRAGAGRTKRQKEQA